MSCDNLWLHKDLYNLRKQMSDMHVSTAASSTLISHISGNVSSLALAVTRDTCSPWWWQCAMTCMQRPALQSCGGYYHCPSQLVNVFWCSLISCSDSVNFCTCFEHDAMSQFCHLLWVYLQNLFIQWICLFLPRPFAIILYETVFHPLCL